MAQSSTSFNPLIKSDENIERIISQKCKRHPLINANLLHLVPYVKNPRICLDCVQQDDIPSKNYLQIIHVLSGSSDSDLFSYPVLTNPQLHKVIQPNSMILDPDYNKIDSFYQELTKQIQTKIKTSRDKQNLKIKQLGEIYQSYLVNWQQITEIDKLQQILYEENNEGKLAKFIDNHILNSESNTQKIQKICQQFQVIGDTFSEEQPNKINNLINSLLEEINFFDANNPSPLRAVQQAEENINAFQKNQQEVDQLLLQLNDCTRQINEAQKTIQSQRLIITELRDKKGNQSKKISVQQQEIKEEAKERSNNLEEQEKCQNNKIIQSFNNQQTIKGGYLGLKRFKKEKVIAESKSIDLLPTAELILSTLYDSQILIVRKNQHEIEFKNDFKIKKRGLAYLNFIMVPQTNYVIQVKLEQGEGQDKNFRFGLIRDSVKDSIFGPYQISYTEQQQQGHFNTLTKGNHLVNEDSWQETRSLEMRINISRTIFKVGALPNYESVVEADNLENLVKAGPQRFFFYGLNCLTKMTIIKLETVSEFDNNM